MPVLADPLPHVRRVVRDLLLSAPAYVELEPDRRRDLAESMVKVCHAASALIREEVESDAQARRANGRHLLAQAQSAGTEFSGVSAQKVAGTTQAILNAVSFPRFVTDLINGVFKAMTDSSQQQMNSYVELLRNVAASTDGFADANLGPDRARSWLVEKYPQSFELSQQDSTDEDAEPPRLQLRDGARLPSPEAMRVDLGLGPDDSVPTGDPESTLVPFARRQLAQTRQSMLATMVMLGMQRIVIDSGRITASMRFHIDTRSAATDDHASRFDFSNVSSGSGSFGIGAWGVSASMQNTIGYVSTQRAQSTEEMNTDLDLNSSVEMVFRTDQVPLNRLAGSDQVSRITQNSLNPQAEAQAASTERQQRLTAQVGAETSRRGAVDRDLTHTTAAPPPGGSVADAEAARRRAASESSDGGTGGHAAGAGQSAAGGGQSAAGGGQSAAGGGQSAAGGGQSAAGGGPSAGGGSQPAAGGSQAPAGGSQPAAGGATAGANPPAAAGGATTVTAPRP